MLSFPLNSEKMFDFQRGGLLDVVAQRKVITTDNVY